MNKRSILLAGLVPVLLLGGCMGTQNRGLESVHQPVVSRTDYVLDLGTTGGALANGERQRLAGWMTSMQLGFGDQVAIDDPAYEARTARDQVAGVVASFGLLLGDTPPVTNAPVTAGTIRVVVSRARATVPGCPDWSRDESHEFDSNTSSNHGCAINGNLAAMIARPEDLVRGRNDSTATVSTVSVVSGKAIDAYRKAAPTGGNGLPGGVTTVSAAGGK